MEQFIRGKGPYVFMVDMTDTTTSYAFDFYTRLDASREELDSFRELRLDCTWQAPSEARYQETVFMPLDGEDRFFTRTVLHPYRAGMIPREAGRWTLTVKAPAAVPHRGLGLVVRKEKWDTEN